MSPESAPRARAATGTKNRLREEPENATSKNRERATQPAQPDAEAFKRLSRRQKQP